ncbi:MAG: undecaprenyldiphospho-muramoylpentapeptide beta-N-acetylglucosaminyltransferase [Clostridiales bacterium]|nr:undecaprenyldiphospho-muramoylpentapeptide beta-N-acetylglucosaminyltransferase [Clostridiales bacterium]
MRALIASSATGGHIYPALAIAEEISRRAPEAEFLFVGAKWEIGKDIVRAAGYRQEFIDVSGFDRRNPLKSIKALCGLMRASGEIKKIIRDFKPDICIGTGGHVAGPVIRMARKAGVRTMIQEQNVIPGMANKLAEKYAERVFVGFKETAGYFKDGAKVVVSGNPVRAAFAEAAARRGEVRALYGISEGAFCVFFFGGSQGAGAINDAAIDAMTLLGSSGETEPGAEYYFFLVTGRDYYGDIKAKAGNMASCTVMEYADAIYELYAAADLIVSRAGALTVTEIVDSGKASILVPSPNVTNNHQYYNAKALADGGAAVLLPEDELTGERLAVEMQALAADKEVFEAMSVAAAGLARADAAKVIADEIFGSPA